MSQESDSRDLNLHMSESEQSEYSEGENDFRDARTDAQLQEEYVRNSTPRPTTHFRREQTPWTPRSTSSALNSATNILDDGPTPPTRTRSLQARLTTIEKKVELISDAQRELSKDVKAILNHLEKGQKRSKTRQAAPVVPPEIRQSVRDGYKDGRQEHGLQWRFRGNGDSNLKPEAPENRPMNEHISTYVKGMYGNAEDYMIKAAISTYYDSLRQADQRKRKGTDECHKQQQVKYERKKRKLKERESALKRKTSWDQNKLDAVRDALRMEYMSSEEEDDSDGVCVFLTSTLSWRSSEYGRVMKELDEKANAIKTPKGKRQTVRKVRGSRVSSRQKPENVPETHAWVLCPDN